MTELMRPCLLTSGNTASRNGEFMTLSVHVDNSFTVPVSDDWGSGSCTVVVSHPPLSLTDTRGYHTL